MIKWVSDNQPERVMMVTECSMSDNIAVENPQVNFVRPCNLCPHMKRITLENIYDCLRLEQHEVTVPDAVIEGARRSVQAMLDLPKPAKPASFDPTKQEKPVDLVAV